MAIEKDIASEILLNPLIYRSDDERHCVASVLEMDIRGYGRTPTEAFHDSVDLVSVQVAFAKFKGNPSLIWKPADPVWFERFAEARLDQLRGQLLDIRPKEESEYRASGMAIRPAHVIARMGAHFQPANA